MIEKDDSLTPTTDEFARSGDASAEDWTDFARQLERELAAVRRHLVRAQGAEADLATTLLRAEKAEAELAESEKDAKEGWAAFYRLRRYVAKDKYPGLTEKVSAMGASPSNIKYAVDESEHDAALAAQPKEKP